MLRALEAFDVSESFSELLRELRLRAGLTQGGLADRAGLSPRTISDLERGVHTVPFRHTLEAIAEALDLTPEQAAGFEASLAATRNTRPLSVARNAGEGFPSPLTPIIDREREIDLTMSLLVRDRVRLLTFTGIAGVGKSRLAVEIFSQLGRSRHNVIQISLGDLEDDDATLPAIAQGLGIEVEEAASAREVIAAHLQGESLIVILENFEQVLGARLELLDLLERCPGLQVLATCRGPLRIRGEHTLLVEPLALPDPTAGVVADVIEASPAVRWFTAVARMRKPDFALTAENAGTVAEIVRRLDGLPLAIELAAAQAAVLSPREILADLQRGPGLLGRPHPDLSAKQQSIRDGILWSYEQLSAPQQRLLRFSSVFPASWNAADLLALNASDPSGPLPATLELLGPLVRCGFVQRIQGAGGESRFRMLHLVKELMQDELRENGEWEESLERLAATGHGG
jgi:predicted ATPase/DNA-binding XRE family transcriptional regulator